MDTAAADPPCGLPGCDGPSPGCGACGCVRRPCGACPVRCCRRDDRDVWLADVGGSLDLDDVPWPAAPRPSDDLPDLIPVLGGGRFAPAPRWPAVGVRWDRVLGDGLWQDARETPLPPPRPGRIAPIQRRWLAGDPAMAAGVAPGTPVVASLVGPDPVIEGLWTYQWHAGIYPALARAGFAAVVGPNYSLYGDQPRFEHRLNIKRSLLAAARMRAAGVPAVPHVYVWRASDGDAVAAWAAGVGLDAVAVNSQTFRAPGEWEQALARYLHLRDRMPAGIRWWFIGVSTRDRVRTLRGLFPGCRILTVDPYELAAHGRRLIPDGQRVRWPARPADLLAENIRVMGEWIH